MSDLIHYQPADSVRLALILDDDPAGGPALRRALGAMGYEARLMTDASAALDVLRANTETVAVFFDVEAYGETLDGEDYACVIGALLREPALAQRHIYGVISSTADDVETALGKTLARLGTPVFSKPFDVATLAGYLAQARHRMVGMATQPLTADAAS
jgi:CheY-like chemotaxis protein